MCTKDALFSARVYQPFPINIINLSNSRISPIIIRKHLGEFNSSRKIRFEFNSNRRRPTFSCKSSNLGGNSSNSDDFMTRVLKENPSQVEPRFKIGENVYTLTEKENLKNKSFDSGFFEVLKKLNLGLKGIVKKNEVPEGKKMEGNVYLKDILRNYKGKLYVPEQMFGTNLSEEEEFDRNFEKLPKMSYEGFVKFMRSGKVKLLTFKEESGMISGNGVGDFIVELKETPGDKSLHLSKWAMRLEGNQAQLVLADYTGPSYEIETRMTVILCSTIVMTGE